MPARFIAASWAFSVFAPRWQEEVLIHKKASTAATMKGHVKNLLIPAFGKLAMGDIDSECELPKGRKLRQRCYTGEEIKRILAHTKAEDRAFFWLAAETGLRAGELIALRASDIDPQGLRASIGADLNCSVVPSVVRRRLTALLAKVYTHP